MQAIKDRVYANSPYDLASNLDNAYRNGADTMFDNLTPEIRSCIKREEIIKQDFKDRLVNRQTHINTLRQDLNKSQDKLHRRNKMIKDLQKQAKKAEESLSIYEEYSDQIEFTQKDIEKLNKLAQSNR